MGRPKLYAGRIVLSPQEGTTTRIDALLEDDEYRLDFIRAAIEAEVEKRGTREPVAASRLAASASRASK